jgi:Sulfatase-modifying factor enzyme 1
MSTRDVHVAAFEIDRRPVTKAQYDACVASDACPAIATGECKPTTTADDPMHCVDWFEAQAYCSWVGKQLPTEDEWELSRSKLERTAKHFDWTVTRHCAPQDEGCLGLSQWSIDGWREPSIETRARGETTTPAPEPHERAQGLGLRCVKPSTTPVAHPGPCWATCDGCGEVPDGEADLRHVARWNAKGEDGAHTIVDATGKRRGIVADDEKLETMVASADPASIVHGATGRAVGFARVTKDGEVRREMLQYDAAGNVRSRISTGPKAREHWTYHYDCWKAGATPHPDRDACPRAEVGVVEPQTDFGRCVAGKGGAWTLVMDRVKIGCTREPGVDMPCLGMEASGTWALAYTPKGGERVLGPVEGFEIESAIVMERRVIGAFDFDDDGHDELVVRKELAHVEDMDPTVEVWTFATVVKPYPAVVKLREIVSMKDVDGDGRPDLRLEGSFTIPSSGEMGVECFGGVTSVARSLPDGTFVVDPVETIADRRAQCPKMPTGAFFGTRSEPRDGLQPIACSYLWGLPKAELRNKVLAQWDAQCANEDAPCMCDRATLVEFVDGLPKLERWLNEP